MAIPTPVSFWNLDESSGNAADAVGSNTLTNNGTTPYAAGLIGNCTDFGTGTGLSLSIADASQSGLDITGDLSISLWFKGNTSFTGQNPCLISKFLTTGNQRSYLLNLNEDTGTFRVASQISSDGGAGTHGMSGTISNPGTTNWHHVVMTYAAASGTGKIYYDNSVIVTDTGFGNSIFNSTASFIVGGNSQGAIDWPKCKIDMVGIWNSTLSPTDVTTLFNGGAGIEYPFPSASIARDARNLSLLGVG